MMREDIIINVLTDKVEQLEKRNIELDHVLHEFVMAFAPENEVEKQIFKEACMLTGEKYTEE